MTRSMKSVWFFGAALLVTLCLQASRAEACTYQCQQVPGKPLFCRQCVDTGSFTNVTCANSGPCGCYFVPNNCGGRAASASSTDSLQEAIFSSPEAQAAAATNASPGLDLPALRLAK